MKKALVVLVALLASMSALFAQKPFLEEGKEWICHTQNPYNGQVYDFRYYLGEEVERYGHVYRELIMENYGNYGRTERCAYLREEGQKVYVLDDVVCTASYWTAMKAVHTTLDVIGLVPVVGELADGLNAGLYLACGRPRKFSKRYILPIISLQILD